MELSRIRLKEIQTVLGMYEYEMEKTIILVCQAKIDILNAKTA